MYVYTYLYIFMHEKFCTEYDFNLYQIKLKALALIINLI